MQDESDQETVGGIKMSEWISVNINDRYAVNRVGEVKNLETNKKLKPSFNKAGYLVVSLSPWG